MKKIYKVSSKESGCVDLDEFIECVNTHLEEGDEIVNIFCEPRIKGQSFNVQAPVSYIDTKFTYEAILMKEEREEEK